MVQPNRPGDKRAAVLIRARTKRVVALTRTTRSRTNVADGSPSVLPAGSPLVRNSPTSGSMRAPPARFSPQPRAAVKASEPQSMLATWRWLRLGGVLTGNIGRVFFVFLTRTKAALSLGTALILGRQFHLNVVHAFPLRK